MRLTIEKKIIAKNIAVTALIALAIAVTVTIYAGVAAIVTRLFVFYDGDGESDETLSGAVNPPEPASISSVTATAAPASTVEELVYCWTEGDVEAMALTLAGECYDDKPHDKRLVCEVILNRVSKGFGNSPLEVCSAPHQFNGYTHQSRPVSENDYETVIQTLKDWHNNDYQALSKWLFFSAGDNRENVFREEY